MTKQTNAADTNSRTLKGGNSYAPSLAIVAAGIATRDSINRDDKADIKETRGSISQRVLEQYADCMAFIAFQGLEAWNHNGASEMRKALHDAKVTFAVAKRLTETSAAFLAHCVVSDVKASVKRIEAFKHGPEHVLSYFKNAGIETQADLIKIALPKQAPKTTREIAKEFIVKTLGKSERDVFLAELKSEIDVIEANEAKTEEAKASLLANAAAQRDARRAARVKGNAKGETVSAEAS